MADRYKDRLKILEDQEIEELYGRPQFNHDERVHFFGLTPEERAVADGHYNLASRVLFILQVGYFKAKTLFFAFKLDDVQEDVRHILQQHYPRFHDAELAAPSLKQIRHTQQRKILDLYGYRACNADERAALMEKAGQLVRISAKPIFLFQNLLQYLESRRIVRCAPWRAKQRRVVPGSREAILLTRRALARQRGSKDRIRTRRRAVCGSTA